MKKYPLVGHVQPRTQAQKTKNRHTTVFLYRSVANLGERAGVLGEDSAPLEVDVVVTRDCFDLKT